MDGAVIAGLSGIKDIDIVIARGEISAGIPPQSDVKAASCIAEQRSSANGHVLMALGVAKERSRSDCRIAETDGVARNRLRSDGCIEATVDVGNER